MSNLFFPPTGSQPFGRPLRKYEISLSFKVTFIFTRKRGGFVLLFQFWWQLRALLNSFGMQSDFSLKIEKASEICISMDYSTVEPGQFRARDFWGIQFLEVKQTQMLLLQGMPGPHLTTAASSGTTLVAQQEPIPAQLWLPFTCFSQVKTRPLAWIPWEGVWVLVTELWARGPKGLRSRRAETADVHRSLGLQVDLFLEVRRPQESSPAEAGWGMRSGQLINQ